MTATLIAAPPALRSPVLVEPPPVRWLLTGVALAFLSLFLLLPLVIVFEQALRQIAAESATGSS